MKGSRIAEQTVAFCLSVCIPGLFVAFWQTPDGQKLLVRFGSTSLLGIQAHLAYHCGSKGIMGELSLEAA